MISVLCFYSQRFPEYIQVQKRKEKGKRKREEKEAMNPKFLAPKYRELNGKQLDETSGLK